MSGNKSYQIKDAGKQLPFSVPKGYFDDFPARMQARIDREIDLSGRGSSLRWIEYVKPALGLAAAFAAVFLLVFWPAKLITNQESLHAGTSGNGYDENLINLVEQVDDNTFFSLLEGSNSNVKLDPAEIETYIASNYSEYDIYLEIQKKQ